MLSDRERHAWSPKRPRRISSSEDSEEALAAMVSPLPEPTSRDREIDAYLESRIPAVDDDEEEEEEALLKEAAENLYAAASRFQEEAAREAAEALFAAAAAPPAAAARRPAWQHLPHKVQSPRPRAADDARGRYHCGRCGKVKVNHVCTLPTALQRSFSVQAAGVYKSEPTDRVLAVRPRPPPKGGASPPRPPPKGGARNPDCASDRI